MLCCRGCDDDDDGDKDSLPIKKSLKIENQC